MVTSKGEYTRDVGKERYAHSAAKVLIYQTGEPLADNLKKYNQKTRRDVPFATFEGAEDGKYPSCFVLRKKLNDGAEKVGGNKDFDPEIYRQQIRTYNASKISAPRRAYTGAGDILHHAGGSRPESQQSSSGPHISTRHGDPKPMAIQVPPVLPPSEAPLSRVPPSEVPPSEATLGYADGEANGTSF